MDWVRILAYITGTVDQELLLRNEYLAAENRILKAQIKTRLRLTDAERVTLAEIAHRLGRKALEDVANVVKPDTLMGWYRRLVARKFDGSKSRRYPGRPRIDSEIEQLVVRMAKENSDWGYDRIAGAMASGQGTWETTLEARDFDSNANTIEGYYDNAQGITWLADANAAVGSAYDTWITGSGTLNWTDANSWVAGLDIAGITGWRLPNTVQPDTSCDSQSGTASSGYNCTGSEMGTLFYNILGNSAGSLLSNTGPFSNIQTEWYWSATPYAHSAGSIEAWLFNMGLGDQYYSSKTLHVHAWAVHDGDVGAAIVPIPAAAWLFGSGLLGLIGVARRKTAA